MGSMHTRQLIGLNVRAERECLSLELASGSCKTEFAWEVVM